MAQLQKKCKPGALLNIMYADAYKCYDSEPENLVREKNMIEYGVPGPSPQLLKGMMVADCDGEARVGRWYWVGIQNFIKLCEKHGYEVLEEDLNIDKTNPLTLFRKRP